MVSREIPPHLSVAFRFELVSLGWSGVRLVKFLSFTLTTVENIAVSYS